MAKIPEDVQGYDADQEAQQAPEAADARAGGVEAGYSDRWWRVSWRMVERGWVAFCAKRGMDPDSEFTPEQANHAECVEHAAMRRARA
jgi:hypothetical protein